MQELYACLSVDFVDDVDLVDVHCVYRVHNVHYSYRKASIGCSAAAFLAG
jgi:hypothetical protein